MLTANLRRLPAPGTYYPNAQLPPGMPMNYAFHGHGGNGGGSSQSGGYYGPTAQASAQTFGGVYYSANGGDNAGGATEHEPRKRGLDVMDNFFSSIKRQEINPQSFPDITRHLQPLLNVPLPFQIPGGAIPDYHAPSMMSHETAPGAYAPSAPSSTYHIDIPHLRSKKDLRNMQVELDTMFDTACESSNAVAAAGMAQHGPNPGMNARDGSSPPGTHMLHMNLASPNGDTPELTSGSSVHSNGHSPTSMDFSNGSPPTGPNPPTQAMYPALPGSSSLANGGSAPSTLGNQYDRDPNRRYSGGRLQKAAPGAASSSEMDIDHDDSRQRANSTTTHARSVFNRMIDPALSGETHYSSGSPTFTAAASRETTYIDEQQVMSMRLLEGLRYVVKAKLDRGEYRDDDAREGGSMYPDLSGTTGA